MSRQNFDSLGTKNLKLLAGSASTYKNGFYLLPNGGYALAINGNIVASWAPAGAAGAVPPQGATALIGQKIAANMNVTTDQNIPLVLSAGFTRWKLDKIVVSNPSISLTTAAGGVYPAAAKGGTPVVAAAQAYAGLTAAPPAAGSSLDLTLAATVPTIEFGATQTALGLFFALTTPQGAAATADIYVYGRMLR